MGSKQSKVPPEEENSFVYRQMIKKTAIADPFIYYQFFELLGEARSLATGQLRAVKKMEKGKNSKVNRHLSKEFDILKQLDHPNIVKMYEMFEDSTHYYIVTEYLEGKDALELLQTSKVITEETAWSIFYQLLLAVNHIHLNKFMHRDIKLENIIYNEKLKSLKLIDFGSALKFEENYPRERRCTGTIHYIAPEVINKFYNNKCDIWSLGILLFVLLSGNAPFVDKEHELIIGKILNEALIFSNPIWKTRSNESKILISKLLQKNFEKRISISEILMDPWVCKFRSQNIIHKPEKELIITCLEHMQKFTKVKLDEIQLGILVFMINVIIKQDNQVGLMKVFNRIDTKEDGEIDEAEIKSALMSYLDLSSKKAEQQTKEFMKKIDIDASGFINYTEFLVSACNLREILTTENIHKTFDFIDTDGSQGLSIDQLRNRLGDHIEQEYYKKLMAHFDKDGDGEICRKQFERMMRGLLSSY